MTTQIVSSFAASLGVKIDQRSFAASERALKRIQELLASFKKYQADLTISPKIKFNTLQLQKQIQTSLNQVSRLTEFKVQRFAIDNAQLNRSLQSAINRAQFATSSVKIKAIVDRSSVSQSARAVARHSEGGGIPGMGSGIGGLVGASRAGVLGVGSYLGYEAVQGLQNQMAEVQRRAGSWEMQRLQLGASVGGSVERRRNNMNALREISDFTGTRAEDSVGGYTKFQKQAMQSGMGARQAIGLYKDMAISTRGNGGDQQSVERQAYALQQVLGLGYLRGEELNQQLADSNPAIKSYIQKAYLQRSGFKGTDSQGVEKFMSDLGKRKVLVQDVLKGYELSAQNAAGRVQELSNSIEGAAARLDNVRWAENLQRSEGELTGAVRDRIQAEKELYDALKPARDMFTELTTQGLKFATWLTTSTTNAINAAGKIPGGTVSHGVAPIPGASPDDPQPGFLTPKKYDRVGSLPEAWNTITSKAKGLFGAPQYGGSSGYPQAPEFLPYNQSDVLNGMRAGSTTNNQQMIQIAPGAYNIEINTTGDATAIAGELERQMQDITDRTLLNHFSTTTLNFPKVGR